MTGRRFDSVESPNLTGAANGPRGPGGRSEQRPRIAPSPAPRRFPAGLLTLGVLLLVASAYADGFGTPLGKRRVRAGIASIADTDDYMVETRAGAPVRVTVSVPSSSDLVPSGTFLDSATGAATGDAFEPKGRRWIGTTTAAADERLAFRIGSDGLTTGAYAISVRAQGAGRTNQRNVAIGAGEEREIPFAAGGAGRLSFSVRGRNGAPNLARIVSPTGATVGVAEGLVHRRPTKLTGKNIDLPAEQPFGTWRLVLVAAGGSLDGLRVSVRVRGGGIVPVKGTLPALEPTLTGVAPDEAGAGTPIVVAFTDLALPARLFVGGVEIADVAANDVAHTLTGDLPAALSGRVDVSVLSTDGHAVTLRDAILAVPPPRPSSVTPARGPGTGGADIEVSGADFRSGVAVTLAGIPFVEATEFVNSGLLRFTTPPFAGGVQQIGVRDPTGQERSIPGGYEFVSPPGIGSVRPPLVPALAGETIRVDGTQLAPDRAVTIGGLPPASVDAALADRLDLTLPTLSLGPHDVVIEDEFGQTATRPDAVSVFTFESGPGATATGGPPPSSMALADYDHDDDLDVFVVSAGGTSLAGGSLLRVLRNDGAAGFTDVTDDVLPAVTTDDWRGNVVTIGDVAADVGAVPPDGWPDIVIGSLDETVLGATRSRIRVLANRVKTGGGRRFEDRTTNLMPEPSAQDDWRSADLWIGDLDGDGGTPDIVGTFDGAPTSVSPLSPYYTYYLSGTRVFSFGPSEGGGYGEFSHQLQRFPYVLGTQVPTQGFPQCGGGACADDYTPFRGTSLAVVDLDGDGRRDVAVTTRAVLRVNGAVIASTQVARNAATIDGPRMLDRTADVNPSLDPLPGDILLSGDIVGGPEPDLVVVRHTVTGLGIAIQIAEFPGFGSQWDVHADTLLPRADGAERLQADDAALVDLDGDGDLDLVLLTAIAPTGGSTTTGRGLRVLRNLGSAGFARTLETLLPSVAAAGDLAGTVLAVDDLDGDGKLTIVVGADDGSGSGTTLDSVRRTLDD